MSDDALPDKKTTLWFGRTAQNLLARLSDRHLGALATVYEALLMGIDLSLSAVRRVRGFVGGAQADSE